MSATATFTPQQVLDAGRRAETDGRRDYAIQFYRHLTDHWSETAEAAAAREGLARLGIRQAGPAPAPTPPNGYGVNGNGSAAGPAMPYPAPTPNASALQREAAAPSRAVDQPHHARHPKYRAGRFVAGFIIGIGLLTMLAGAGFIVAAAAAKFGTPMPLPPVIPALDPLMATALLGGGLFVMFCGQLAQAVFDGANAVRDLAQFEHERTKRRD